MELVDGDNESPTLISNVEVMELLQRNLDARAATTTQNNKKTNKRNNKQFRHRDWIEEEVHRYLRSTPCVKLDPNRREEFHAILKSHKRLCKSSNTQGDTANESTNNKLKEETQQQQGDPVGFGLTEAEALQIMNMMPTKPVEIHLMVDELSSRMTEARQEDFLAFIASYCKEQQSGASTTNNGMEAMEDDAPKYNAHKHNVSNAVMEKWLENGSKNVKQPPSPAAVNVKQEEGTYGDDPQTGRL